MTNWVQAFRQTTTYLGVAVIAIIWGGIYLLAAQERESAYQDAVRQGNNLSRVLEEYIRRVVQNPTPPCWSCGEIIRRIRSISILRIGSLARSHIPT